MIDRLGENITRQKETAHPSAHHSTANKYISGSGWMSCICCCCCFCLEGVVFFVFTRVVFAYKCKSYKRLGKNKQKTNQQQNNK